MSVLLLERYIAIMDDGQPLHEELYLTEVDAREAAMQEIEKWSGSKVLSGPELRRIVRIRVPGVVEAGRENELAAGAGALA